MSHTAVSFAELALPAPLLKTLAHIGYEQPSPIQAESIPPLMEGRDLLGTAQTGTGKTAAFALPLLTRIDTAVAQPQVLVLAPTRELAIQVSEAFKSYAAGMNQFRVLPIYGGADIGGQIKALKRGPQVIVGTPGRVMDHLRRKTLKLDQLQSVVLDEADEMLRMGFIEDVNWILSHTPEERQIALFSATMPAPIKKLSAQYLNNPVEIKIKADTATVDRIEQSYWLVKGTNKLDALTRILEVEDFDGVIMFARTKNMTVELADKLEARGYRSAAINGDMTQKIRERTIKQLKDEKIDILVATDVAARGIDVARVSHVINFDIPYDTEAYVHRIGRTGRAGRDGKAILFVAPRERHLLRAIEKATRQTIEPMTLPCRETVQKQREEKLVKRIVEAAEQSPREGSKELVLRLLEENGIDAQHLAVTLLEMVHTEPTLPAQDFPEPRESAAGKGKRERKAGRREDPVPMESFHIAVGRKHKVKPGNIVGAIANEAGIESQHIGRIQLGNVASTVDLPIGMPSEVLEHLKTVVVCGQTLDMQRVSASGKTSSTAKASRAPSKRPANNKKNPKDKGKPNKKKAAKRKKPSA
ncbi:cold-shock deAd box protein a [gamma proteobacterium HTCC5015]|nr:cold-shock deAd box protein a [gamma proteobacterium HTCC5015]